MMMSGWINSNDHDPRTVVSSTATAEPAYGRSRNNSSLIQESKPSGRSVTMPTSNLSRLVAFGLSPCFRRGSSSGSSSSFGIGLGGGGGKVQSSCGPGAATSVATTLQSSTLSPVELQHTTRTEETWKWRMDERNVKFAPTLASLPSKMALRKNICLECVLPLQDVLDRISSFMRIQSIPCFFNAEDGSINCFTRNRTSFMVNLWRKQPRYDADFALSIAMSQHTWIVEVERRQGCAIEMQRIRRNLFAALRSAQYCGEPNGQLHPLAPYEQPCSHSVSSVVARKHARQKKHFGTAAVTAVGVAKASRTVCPLIKKLYNEKVRRKEICDISRKKSCCDGILKCVRLLDSDCQDQQRLGMEHAVYLTDRTTVDQQTAYEVARTMLLDHEHERCGESLRDRFRIYIQDVDALKLKQRQHDANELVEFTAQTEHSIVMHYLALQALANALDVLLQHHQRQKQRWKVKNHQDNRAPLLDLDTDFWKGITAVLLYNMAESVTRPHECCVSARCVTLLDEIVPGTAERLVGGSRLLPHLVRAHQFGEVHNLTLKQELENLMTHLSGAFAKVDQKQPNQQHTINKSDLVV